MKLSEAEDSVVSEIGGIPVVLLEEQRQDIVAPIVHGRDGEALLPHGIKGWRLRRRRIYLVRVNLLGGRMVHRQKPKLVKRIDFSQLVGQLENILAVLGL
jgi:uncharacterized C2H2 Zn-finger protein